MHTAGLWNLRQARKPSTVRPRDRGRIERRELPSCTVGFLGFPQPLPIKTRGVLERCGIQPVELAGVDAAARVLETLTMCAVALDTHRRELTRVDESLESFLRATSSPLARTPLIVLTSTNLPADTRCRYLDAGAMFLPARHQTRRQLAFAVRLICGLPRGCCEAHDRMALT